MVKGKDPSAFYEVLKGAADKPHGEEAAKPAEGTVPPAVRAPMPPIRTMAAGSMGENVIRIKYDAAAFLAVVIIGLLFLAFALGVRYGKNQSPETPTTPATTESDGNPSSAADATSGSRTSGNRDETDVGRSGGYWSVYLVDHVPPADKNELKNLKNVYIKRLSEVGLDGSLIRAEQMFRRSRNLDVFFYGKFVDPKSDDAVRILNKIKSIKQTDGKPIFPNAQLEQVKESGWR